MSMEASAKSNEFMGPMMHKVPSCPLVIKYFTNIIINSEHFAGVPPDTVEMAQNVFEIEFC